MQTQTHLLLLQKTMVTVAGVARSLDPNINSWEAARPVIEDWARANLGPEALLRDAAGRLLRIPRRLPGIAERPEKPAGDGISPSASPTARGRAPIRVLQIGRAHD